MTMRRSHNNQPYENHSQSRYPTITILTNCSGKELPWLPTTDFISSTTNQPFMQRSCRTKPGYAWCLCWISHIGHFKERKKCKCVTAKGTTKICKIANGSTNGSRTERGRSGLLAAGTTNLWEREYSRCNRCCLRRWSVFAADHYGRL